MLSANRPAYQILHGKTKKYGIISPVLNQYRNPYFYLRSKIYPQSGTDAVIVAVDIVTVAKDGAGTEDKCGVVRKHAGRPQPPAGGSVTCGINAVRPHAWRSRLLRRRTLSCFVRTEVFVDLCNTQKEYLIRSVIPG